MKQVRFKYRSTKSRNCSSSVRQVTTSNELELLYSPMFSELLNGTSHVVSKSSDVHAADNLDKRQQHNKTKTSTITDGCRSSTQLNISFKPHQLHSIPTVTAHENIFKQKTIQKMHYLHDDEFINNLVHGTRSRGDIIQQGSQLETDGEIVYVRTHRRTSQFDRLEFDRLKKAFMVSNKQPERGMLNSQLLGIQLDSPKRNRVRNTHCGLKIFRYLKELIHMGSGIEDNGFELTAFSDSDHAGCLDSRKRHLRHNNFEVLNKLVSWSSKKQNCTSVTTRNF
ncbi:hypothetical protein Tco_0531222 [Tanacetum coccineum]